MLSVTEGMEGVGVPPSVRSFFMMAASTKLR